MARKRPSQHSLRLRGDIPSAAVGVSGAKNALHKAQVLADNAGVPVTKVIHQTPNGQVTAVGGLSSSLTVAADAPVGAERPGIKRKVPEISVYTTVVLREERKYMGTATKRRTEDGYYEDQPIGLRYRITTRDFEGFPLADTFKGEAVTTVLRTEVIRDDPDRASDFELDSVPTAQVTTPVRISVRSPIPAEYLAAPLPPPTEYSGSMVIGAFVYRGLLLVLRADFEGASQLEYWTQDDPYEALFLRWPTLARFQLTGRQAYQAKADLLEQEFDEALPPLWRKASDDEAPEAAYVAEVLEGYMGLEDVVLTLLPALFKEYVEGATEHTLPNNTPPGDGGGVFTVSFSDAGVRMLKPKTGSTPEARTTRRVPLGYAGGVATEYAYKFHITTTEGEGSRAIGPTDFPGVEVSAAGVVSAGGHLFRMNDGAPMGVTSMPHYEERTFVWGWDNRMPGFFQPPSPADPAPTEETPRLAYNLITAPLQANRYGSAYYAAVRRAFIEARMGDLLLPDNSSIREVRFSSMSRDATHETPISREGAEGPTFLGALKAHLAAEVIYSDAEGAASSTPDFEPLTLPGDQLSSTPRGTAGDLGGFLLTADKLGPRYPPDVPLELAPTLQYDHPSVALFGQPIVHRGVPMPTAGSNISLLENGDKGADLRRAPNGHDEQGAAEYYLASDLWVGPYSGTLGVGLYPQGMPTTADINDDTPGRVFQATCSVSIDTYQKEARGWAYKRDKVSDVATVNPNTGAGSATVVYEYYSHSVPLKRWATAPLASGEWVHEATATYVVPITSFTRQNSLAVWTGPSTQDVKEAVYAQYVSKYDIPYREDGIHAFLDFKSFVYSFANHAYSYPGDPFYYE